MRYWYINLICRYKFTRVRDGASRGVGVTYFKCVEPHCKVKCRTPLMSLANPPPEGITFVQVRLA